MPRRRGVLLVTATLIVTLTQAVGAQEGVFLSEEDAPRAVFPEADRVERRDVAVDDALREQLRAKLAATPPSIWESHYTTFTAWKGSTQLGRAFLVEEIGKHRPITFVVGVRPDGRVQDVAVVAYREAYGGEIRNQRFLVQYKDKSGGDSLEPYQAITNIAGATLSVEAASRAVKKALALAAATAADSGVEHP